MSKLDEYAKINEIKVNMFKDLTRHNGPFTIGPTNRGGQWLRYDGKDLFTDVSLKQLRELKDLIDCFLTEVAE